MRKIDHLFADYASYHRTGGNKACHRAGIPMIMFSLLGMLALVKLPALAGVRLDLALVLIVLTSIWYVALDRLLGALMTLVAVLMWALSLYVPLPVHVALFVGGWIMQFIGHIRYEGRSPAFTRNLVHLLVGPLWILSDLLPEQLRVRPSRPA